MPEQKANGAECQTPPLHFSIRSVSQMERDARELPFVPWSNVVQAWGTLWMTKPYSFYNEIVTLLRPPSPRRVEDAGFLGVSIV